MRSLIGVFLASLLLAFSGAMMPGPLLTATIGESARRGALSGPLLMLGHALLEFGLLLALLLGLAPLLSQDRVFVGIALLGAGILLWMAFDMLRSLPHLSLAGSCSTAPSNSLVISGALMSLSNPYWTIWWATIGLGYLASCQALGLAGVAAFFIGHIAADFVWYSFIAVLVARGRRLLSDRLYRGLIGACAVFLAGFAVYFVRAGLQRLLG